MKIDIFTDGACSGNPGPGGYGSILVYIDKKGKEHKKTFSGGFKNTTNNRMELYSVIVALENIKKDQCELTIYSDSQYIVNSISKGWLKSWEKKNFIDRKNTDLWKIYLSLVNDHKIKMVWVKGHAGHSMNEECDELATSAIKNTSKLFEDIGYKK